MYKTQNLESIRLLKTDKLLCKEERLIDFFDNNDAHILTVRRNHENLFKQIEFLGLDSLKERTIILSPADRNVKRNWIEFNCSKKNSIVMIGDSEVDLMAGELEFVKVIIVKSGLRNPLYFLNKSHDSFRIIEDINELL